MYKLTQSLPARFFHRLIKDNEYLEQLAQNTPLKRSGNSNEVTEALLFLLRSDFITGEILRITGGEEL